MKWKNAKVTATFRWFLRLSPIGVILLAPACLESRPKDLGPRKPSIYAVDTANSETFRFNFAYRDPAEPSPVTVQLQGVANSNTVMISTCNAAGTGCLCDFYKNDGTFLSSATASYDTVGNFYNCTYSGTLADLVKVKIRNLTGAKTSDFVPVATVLTPVLLVGSNLDANKVRSVSRYRCQFNYLEKIGTGTTSAAFNCASSLQLCGTVNNFCLLEVTYPFFVYSDNYSTNTFKQMSDLVYNAGATNVLCGRQLKQFDCSAATTGTTLTKQFGLYADQTGNFQFPILLNPAPNQSREIYGYAAKVGLSGNCPPGMLKRDIFSATVAAIADTSLGGDTARDISFPATTPTAVDSIRRFGDTIDPLLGTSGTGGQCDGTTCFPAVKNAGDTNKQTVGTATYTASGSQFCVIDPAILP